jgi:hypothetical protein
MRSAIIATLVVFASWAGASIASAEHDSETINPAPSANDSYGGLTAKEHGAIPYVACRDPSPKWVNGRLRCDNRY